MPLNRMKSIRWVVRIMIRRGVGRRRDRRLSGHGHGGAATRQLPILDTQLRTTD